MIFTLCFAYFFLNDNLQIYVAIITGRQLQEIFKIVFDTETVLGYFMHIFAVQ